MGNILRVFEEQIKERDKWRRGLTECLVSKLDVEPFIVGELYSIVYAYTDPYVEQAEKKNNIINMLIYNNIQIDSGNMCCGKLGTIAFDSPNAFLYLKTQEVNFEIMPSEIRMLKQYIFLYNNKIIGLHVDMFNDPQKSKWAKWGWPKDIISYVSVKRVG